MDEHKKLGQKIKIISNTFSRAVNCATADLGLTGPQSFILGFLLVHRDDPPCQHDIETKFNLKHPTVTGILQRLEEKGMVTFSPDENDKRMKRIRITEDGISLGASTAAVLDSTEAALTSDLSDDELAELNLLLDKIVSNAIKLNRSTEKEDL